MGSNQIGPDTAWVMRQAFIKRMDRTEKGALAFCNKVIADWGGTPQDILAPGIRTNADECPISETIRRGIGHERVVTGITECHVGHRYLDGRNEDYKLSVTATNFAHEFDRGLRPTYDKRKESDLA